MKQLLLFLVILPTVAFSKYVPGDGTLDFTCRDVNTNAKPYNYFQLVMMYDDASENSGFDLISDENLSSGNGDIVYQMQVVQLPFHGAEILSFPQVVPGCSAAPLTMTVDEESGNFELYFECDGDGDAGNGQLTMSLGDGRVSGTINFPEGQSQLTSPLDEDTKIEVTCEATEL